MSVGERHLGRRPRIGLVCDRIEGTGGLFVAQARHARLLAGEVDVVLISLVHSAKERDHGGRIEVIDEDGLRAYRIIAANLLTDVYVPNQADDNLHHTYAESIVDIARDERLDAIHVFGAYKNRALIGAYVAARTGLPLILTFRGTDLSMRLFGSSLAGISRAVAIAAACVCLNQDAANLLRNLFRPACPVHIIPNHVDSERFAATPGPRPMLPAGPTIGTVAEFRRVTGLDYLLQAFARVASQRQVQLCLIGPIRPLEAMYYNAAIEQHPHASRIVRAGTVPHAQMPAWLQACDLLVFPSLCEGSPNKVLEAMACARPIVATRVPGIVDTIREGRDGLLVPARNSEALAEAIVHLLDDPDHAQALAASARERVLAEFDAATERERWLELFAGMP